MSNTINNGGPAFPEHHYFDPDRGAYGTHITSSDAGCGGMSLRDWFAAHAPSDELYDFQKMERTESNGVTKSCAKFTPQQLRYFWADAMIAAREAQP